MARVLVEDLPIHPMAWSSWNPCVNYKCFCQDTRCWKFRIQDAHISVQDLPAVPKLENLSCLLTKAAEELQALQDNMSKSSKFLKLVKQEIFDRSPCMDRFIQLPTPNMTRVVLQDAAQR